MVPVTFIVVPRSSSPSRPREEASEDTEIANGTLLLDEAEERFLRNLGWVPDEEDHVPELTQEEISQMQKILSAQKCQK